jgi:membrane-associated protein
MDWITSALDIFLHLDEHLNIWAGTLGPWLYVVLFVVIFCETGLVVTPFLPGDSLLFAIGALVSIEGSPLSLPGVLVLLWVAAVLGDAVNYAVGHFVGPKVFSSPRSWLLNPDHIRRTHEFYARHGGKTIFLARFVPIVRTFAPFIAGIGEMSYPQFAMWNVTGALVWVGGLVLAGYFFGRIPLVQQNFETVILAIIAVSVMPLVAEWLRARRRRGAVGDAPGPPKKPAATAGP